MSRVQRNLFSAGGIFHVKRGKAGFGARVFEARLHLDRKVGRRVTLQRFAQMVGDELKEAPVSPSSVKRWEEGTVPDVATIAAIAAVCGVSPGWPAFGEGEGPEGASKAPARKQRHSAEPEGSRR
jgi:transcriptional regulator with XRE-family HTH domain